MGSRTAQKASEPTPTNYAVAKSLQREAVRKRIHEQVLHPIDTPSLLRDPLYHPTSPIDSTIGSLKLLLTAIAVHGFIILVFAAVNDLMGAKAGFTAPDRVVVQVIETEPVPPPPPVVEPEKEVIEAPVQPDFVPKEPEPPKPEVTKPKPPKDPVKPKVVKKPQSHAAAPRPGHTAAARAPSHWH